jgi:pimeloyl-ACP methyl ester carboxylesterase
MKVLVVLFLGYAGFVVYLYFFQRSMIYFPQPKHLSHTPEMILQRPDALIQVTIREYGGPDAIIYFGGNAEDVSFNLPDFTENFPHHALYLMHYRNYGSSEGKPSEKAIMEDAFALFDEVAKKHKNIVVVGRSLGTGVAVRLASQRPASRVVLITPYDSIERIAMQALPYIPVKWLLKDKYESFRYAKDISVPTLIFMASKDEVIPAKNTERLYHSFRKGVATLTVIPQTGHNTISYTQDYQKAFVAFLNAPHPRQ